jgi:hypothetical protein
MLKLSLALVAAASLLASVHGQETSIGSLAGGLPPGLGPPPPPPVRSLPALAGSILGSTAWLHVVPRRTSRLRYGGDVVPCKVAASACKCVRPLPQRVYAAQRRHRSRCEPHNTACLHRFICGAYACWTAAARNLISCRRFHISLRQGSAGTTPSAACPRQQGPGGSPIN